MDRIPPNSPQAELAVLGVLLEHPVEAMDAIMARAKSLPELFYTLQAQQVARVVEEMSADTKPITPTSVAMAMSRTEGAISYLGKAQDINAAYGELPHYLDELESKYIARKIIHVTAEAQERAYGRHDAMELLDEVERNILEIRPKQGSGDKTLKDFINEVIDDASYCHEHKGALRGLLTGYPDLDEKTLGLQGGDMVVIAARPSMGKTSLGMNIAEHVAVDQRRHVLVFSLEMTGKAIIRRMACSRGRILANSLKNGTMNEGDFQKFTNVTAKINSSPLTVIDRSGMTIQAIRAKARRVHARKPVEMIVIDYLQKVNPTRRSDSRTNDLAEVSDGIKEMAKELNIPVITLAQLNRDVEKGGDARRPRMSDLAECGRIEQDADLIAFIYQKDPLEQPQLRTVYVAKQRDGETGEVDLFFQGAYTRFESVKKEPVNVEL